MQRVLEAVAIIAAVCSIPIGLGWRSAASSERIIDHGEDE